MFWLWEMRWRPSTAMWNKPGDLVYSLQQVPKNERWVGQSWKKSSSTRIHGKEAGREGEGEGEREKKMWPISYILVTPLCIGLMNTRWRCTSLAVLTPCKSSARFLTCICAGWSDIVRSSSINYMIHQMPFTVPLLGITKVNRFFWFHQSFFN